MAILVARLVGIYMSETKGREVSRSGTDP